MSTDLFILAQSVWQFVVGAAGLSALIVIIVNALKQIRINGEPIAKDGNAKTWYTIVQFAIVALITAYKVTVPDAELSALDEFVKIIIDTFGAILAIALPAMAKLGDLFYRLGIRNVPIIGKSHE